MAGESSVNLDEENSMKIEINSERIEHGKNLDHFAMCCAGFELGAQKGQIDAVQIRVDRAHEPQEGKHHRCLVQVELANGHKIFTKATDADLHFTIFRALERAGWMVARREQREADYVAHMPTPDRHGPRLSGPDLAA